jgi:hypothetical protein
VNGGLSSTGMKLVCFVVLKFAGSVSGMRFSILEPSGDLLGCALCFVGGL